MWYLIKRWWKNRNNPKKLYEVVEFIDGTYGIRKVGSELYHDFKCPLYWWSVKSMWFETECKVQTEQEALNVYNELIRDKSIIKRVVK